MRGIFNAPSRYLIRNVINPIGIGDRTHAASPNYFEVAFEAAEDLPEDFFSGLRLNSPTILARPR